VGLPNKIHWFFWAGVKVSQTEVVVVGVVAGTVASWEYILSEYHTEPTVSTVRPIRSMRTVTPKPQLFLLC